MSFFVTALRSRTRCRMYSMEDLHKKIDNERSVSCLSLTELNDDIWFPSPLSSIYKPNVTKSESYARGYKRQRPQSTASQLSWMNASYEALSNSRSDDIIGGDSDDVITGDSDDCLSQTNESHVNHLYDSIQDKSLKLTRIRHRRNKKRLRKNQDSCNDLSSSLLLLHEEPVDCREDGNVYEPVEWRPPVKDQEKDKLQQKLDTELPVLKDGVTCVPTESDFEKENDYCPTKEIIVKKDNTCVNRNNSIQLKSWQIRRQRRAILNMRRKTERYGAFAPHRQEREL